VRHANQHGHAAIAFARLASARHLEDLLHRLANPDGVEGDVDSAGRLTPHQLSDARNRVLVARIDGDRRAELPGKGEFVVCKVDDDDRKRTQVGARLHN
jgi:hypothetical protein